MLLIASDLFKAIWYFIPAVMFLAGHPITNAFCQADGFLVSMGLEASGRYNQSSSMLHFGDH